MYLERDVVNPNISTHDLTKRSTLFRLCSGFLLGYFNSRPHEEVDPFPKYMKTSTRNFNSRPHEEVDKGSVCFTYDDIIFQLTTSRRGRQDRQEEGKVKVDISTHDLTKRSTTTSSVNMAHILFQLTTSRRGRRTTAEPGRWKTAISTHDLTKRSTGGRPGRGYREAISTHDLTKRSTQTPRTCLDTK